MPKEEYANSDQVDEFLYENRAWTARVTSYLTDSNQIDFVEIIAGPLSSSRLLTTFGCLTDELKSKARASQNWQTSMKEAGKNEDPRLGPYYGP